MNNNTDEAMLKKQSFESIYLKWCWLKQEKF